MVKNILFDFDGVIIDSMQVRDYGFKLIFKDYDSDIVEEFIKYHRYNGGLSRYVKIRYFFEKLLNESIDEKHINELAEQFSSIMKKELVRDKYLISETVEFLKNNCSKYNLHIVSGSDEIELRFLCKELGLETYFISIHGSPTPKIKLVQQILEDKNYNIQETLLIGDSINDLEAAKANNIRFIGYNNVTLKKYEYAETMKKFEEVLTKGYN